MGSCVLALNAYHKNNPDAKLENYVYRLLANKQVGQYDGALETVNFTETFEHIY